MSSASNSVPKLLWFLTGAAIGTAVALLVAPSPGSEIRSRIGGKAEKGADALAESGKELLEKGRDLYEEGRRIADEAAEMFERGRKLVEG